MSWLPSLRTPAGVAALAALCACVPARAQHLPANVTPEHYRLALTPDLVHATFTGDERIEVKLAQPAATITLNAAEITFQSVTATVNGQSQTATVSLDKDKEQATFTFPQPLAAGPVTLAIAYTGILNGELRGFYLSKTAKRNYAVTQFEPTDARRAYPSFDEPALKATYSVSLTIDKGDTAISNTNIVSDVPAGPGKHTLSFATTPRMSTYLVAFLVGDFQCSSGESDGVPIRACSTPDKVALTKYAVEAATFVLHYYDNYFGIKYPLPKLDMIAIPDFEAGAMENFGAITYRETDFLIDAAHASVEEKERVAHVVAHEMAHQWFGDMVTMQWWNNLWLNEGFASWMENKPVAAWHPEWKIPEQEAASLDGTMNLDSQAVTRTIRAEAETPDQINEMFDGITYQKGEAVLGMVESWVGEEAFRRGVHNYLAAHMLANATAEDFWDTQTRTSGKPVDKVMQSFVGQPGVPLLTFGAPSGGSATVAQSRFFLSPAAQQAHASDPAEVWTVPVCLKSGGAESCSLVTTGTGTVPAPGADLFANAHAKGYYRSSYPEAVRASLRRDLETKLSAPERILLLGDEWSGVRAGKESVSSWLALAEAVRDDKSSPMIGALVDDLNVIYARVAATEEQRTALAAWVRRTFAPGLAALGDPRPGEEPETSQLRMELFALVGGLGRDPGTIAKARQITETALRDPDAVDPNLRVVAVQIAAENGDAELFDKLQHVFETSANPQLQEGALHALALFRDPALVRRSLTYAASGKVRNQDSIFLFAIPLTRADTRETAWQFIQANWPAVSAQLTEMNGGAVVSSAGSFCSDEKAQEVQQFFSTHPVHAAERALARAQAQIHSCVEFRNAEQPDFQTWLSAHAQ